MHFLKTYEIPTSIEVTSAPTNHTIVIDCSGSMGNDLPKIRQHIKNKIVSLVKPDDTLSVVWFSGKNQCGTLIERASINGLTDLANINACIDRFLKPVGLTSFVDPLKEVISLIKRNAEIQHTLIFMTDGYDNQNSMKQIIDACNGLNDTLVSSTFVEYGMYAAHDTLLQMAEATAGSLVEAEDFSKYAFTLDQIKTTSFGKRTKVVLHNNSAMPYVIGHTNIGFVVSTPDINNVVTFPSNVTHYTVFEKTQSSLVNQIKENSKDLAAVVAALIQRGNADLAMEVAADIGDVQLFEKLSNAFSKQDLMRVVDFAVDISTGVIPLYQTAPKTSGLLPEANAYNVLELLQDLAEHGNKLCLGHQDFQYKSIATTKRETAEVDGFVPTFTKTSETQIADISSVTFNDERPNVSLLVKQTGQVNLPDNEFVGNKFDSFIWRNYTIVLDGIVNVKKLPVMLTKKTYDKIVSRGVKLDPFKVGSVYPIDVSKLPVINRSMVTDNKLSRYFELSLREYFAMCQMKYLKSFLSDDSKVSASWKETLGDDAVQFLAKYGVTESGFRPKTITTNEQVDSYTAKVFKTRLVGLSSIPKVADILKPAKKLSTNSQLIAKSAFDFVDIQLDGKSDTDSVNKQIEIVKLALKAIREELTRIKFGVIIGKRWFVDSTGYDDASREVTVLLGNFNKPIKCEVQLLDEAA